MENKNSFDKCDHLNCTTKITANTSYKIFYQKEKRFIICANCISDNDEVLVEENILLKTNDPNSRPLKKIIEETEK